MIAHAVHQELQLLVDKGDGLDSVLFKAMKQAAEQFEGSYALGLVSVVEPDMLITLPAREVLW